MLKKSRLTFVIPETLYRELHSKIVQDGYDLRGKSKWISEAIEALLSLDNFEDLVKISDEMHSFNKVQTIALERSLKKLIDVAGIKVRQRYPSLEGVQSSIIRTAIVQRLL